MHYLSLKLGTIQSLRIVRLRRSSWTGAPTGAGHGGASQGMIGAERPRLLASGCTQELNGPPLRATGCRRDLHCFAFAIGRTRFFRTEPPKTELCNGLCASLSVRGNSDPCDLHNALTGTNIGPKRAIRPYRRTRLRHGRLPSRMCRRNSAELLDPCFLQPSRANFCGSGHSLRSGWPFCPLSKPADAMKLR
jgi:hypothetical protein